MGLPSTEYSGYGARLINTDVQGNSEPLINTDVKKKIENIIHKIIVEILSENDFIDSNNIGETKLNIDFPDNKKLYLEGLVQSRVSIIRYVVETRLFDN